MNKETHLLVIRLSSMGDVLMTVPVLKTFVAQYPDIKITVATQAPYQIFFEHIPELYFYPVYTKGKHQGIQGIFRLYQDLSKIRITHLVDLHDVLRSKLLRMLFSLNKVHIAYIDKGRDEKNKLTQKIKKLRVPLKTTFERYADVFSSLGYPIALNNILPQKKPLELSPSVLAITGYKKGSWIGIAPFSKHKGKVYPAELMKKLLQIINEQSHMELFLFGAGEYEQNAAQGLCEHLSHVHSVIGKLSLSDEIALLSHLDVMLSMDSANMHMASLIGLRVISIWGATHPYAGFYSWGQDLSDIIQDDIECRPCSVYGNKPCFRKDYACLFRIDPERIAQKLMTTLKP